MGIWWSTEDMGNNTFCITNLVDHDQLTFCVDSGKWTKRRAAV